MADKFLQNDGVDVGYWSKRREQFQSEIGRGLNFALNKVGKTSGSPVKKKRKHNTSTEVKDESKTPTKKRVADDEYTKKVLDNGRVMHFKGRQLVSKDEYEKNTGDK